MFRRTLLALGALALTGGASIAPAQSTFDGTVSVLSEWKAQDRGDGSGTYQLANTVTGGSIVLEHNLSANRDVQQEITITEAMRLMENGSERAHAGGDPTALGPWADTAARYVLPFAVDFSGVPRRNYRPNDRLVKTLVQSVVPEAKISTRAATDGRTTAEVEIPGTFPVNVLAEKFLGIRQALREAEVGLAKLRIRGTASAPEPAPEAEDAAAEPSGR